MGTAIVLDARGQQLSTTHEKKARRLVQEGKASLVSEDPLTVQLAYAVDLPVAPEPEPALPPGQDKRLLLHVCCAPCGTYSVERFRELGFTVSGLWLSYAYDLTSGASIIMVSGVVFLISLLIDRVQIIPTAG